MHLVDYCVCGMVKIVNCRCYNYIFVITQFLQCLIAFTLFNFTFLTSTVRFMRLMIDIRICL
jgi:hypothetical protein